MKAIAVTIWLFTVLSALAGCASKSMTRFPRLMAQHPAVEKRAFQIHDPLPDSNLGPDMQNRPREFNVQRTESRRFRDIRHAFEHGRQLNPQPQATAPAGLFGSKYPNVVHP